MPFMLVALAYVIMSGQPVDEPVRFIHSGSFADLAACQAYMVSDIFGIEREALAAHLKRAASTRLAPPLNENDAADELSSGDLAIAITTSCEEDKRI